MKAVGVRYPKKTQTVDDDCASQITFIGPAAISVPEVEGQEVVAGPGVHDRHLPAKFGVASLELLEAPILF